MTAPPPIVPPESDGPEHNARGFFVIGPQCVNPCDLLARLQKYQHCEDPTPTPQNSRKAMRIYSSREAQRQRERKAQQHAA